MKREEAVLALRRAASAYLDLLRRLESDGYLKTPAQDMRIVSTVLHEMAAYAAALSDRCGYELEKAVGQAMSVFLPETDELQLRISYGVRCRAESFLENCEETPSCYKALDRFDAMALSFGETFYHKLGVNAPGRLADRYIELLQGFGRVIELQEDPEEKGISVTDQPVWMDAVKALKEAQSQIAL